MQVAHLTDNHYHVQNIPNIFREPRISRQVIFARKPNKIEAGKDVIRDLFTADIDSARYYDEDNIEEIARLLADFDLVIAHALSDINIQLINAIHSDKPTIAWKGWGYDYLDLLYDNFEGTLEYYTTKEYHRLKQDKSTRYKPFTVSSDKKLAISRIDFFCPVIFEEFNAIRTKNQCCSHFRYFDWQYGFEVSLDALVDVAKPNAKKELVWLGNSAFITNNHLDYFECVKNKPDILSLMHTLPLSYGFENYKNTVRKKAQALIPDIRFLEDFLNFSDYFNTLNSHKYMVMPHIRQQALGNIWLGLLAGNTVFLNEKSLVYKYFCRLGAFVRTLAELDACDNFSELELSDDERTVNTQLAISAFSEETMRNKTKLFLDQVSGKKK